MKKIHSFISEISDEMVNAAISAFQNEKFIFGESVFKFEEEFAKYIGTKYAIAVNSGSSAIQLSLMSLGLKKDADVITSTNSFVASANTIKMANGNPILADIHESDGNLNIDGIEKSADAIVPVHIYGNPCDFKKIREFADERKIPIVEDACQAHGATFDGKKVGGLGDLGCFSFYPTKNMTVGGDGGMVTTDNEDLAKIVTSLRDNGRNETNRALHERLGFTMRLNTINAAIGRVELRELDRKNKRRQEIYNLYKKNLKQDILLSTNPNGESVFHQIVIKHEKRDEIKEHLEKNGISTIIHYPIPIHKQPIYLEQNLSLPISEDFSKKILSLPSYPQLLDDDIILICDKMNQVI